MTTKTVPRMTTKVRDAYLELVREFPLTSIRSERQLKEAQRVMDQLLAQGKLTAGAAAYLDALSDLVGAYEDVRYPLPAASDADMLRHLLEAKGITQTELCRATSWPRRSPPKCCPASGRLAKTWSANWPVISTSIRAFWRPTSKRVAFAAAALLLYFRQHCLDELARRGRAAEVAGAALAARRRRGAPRFRSGRPPPFR